MDEQPRKPFDPTPIIIRNAISSGVGIGAAILYGFITRSALNDMLNGSGALSVAFFVLLPPALGFLTIMLAPVDRRTSVWYVILAPWIACSACMVIAAIFAWEFGFCIILALPAFLILSSFGGGLAALVWTIARSIKGSRMGALVIVLALPYVSGAIERTFPAQTWTRRVETRVEIAAPAEVVWGNITNLHKIQDDERPWSLYHAIGLPRPVEAVMACQQVGCVRRGAWEDGLSFDGVITEITPGRSYWVALTADTSGVRSSSAPLKAVGGKAFGMIDDGYEIEPLGEGRSALHLFSTYRVTSRINPYASLWLDFLMRDIQASILSVEKARSEQQVGSNDQ